MELLTLNHRRSTRVQASEVETAGASPRGWRGSTPPELAPPPDRLLRMCCMLDGQVSPRVLSCVAVRRPGFTLLLLVTLLAAGPATARVPRTPLTVHTMPRR